jgi:hypothetical protein
MEFGDVCMYVCIPLTRKSICWGGASIVRKMFERVFERIVRKMLRLFSFYVPIPVSKVNREQVTAIVINCNFAEPPLGTFILGQRQVT